MDAKLNKAKELRVQAAKAQMQADSLLKRAKDNELEAVKNEAKSGEKMRGRYSESNYRCYADCLNYNHGDAYTCNRACGFY